MSNYDEDSKMEDAMPAAAASNRIAVFDESEMPRLMSLPDLLKNHQHLVGCNHSSTQGVKKKASESSASYLSDAVRSANLGASMEVASAIDPWQSSAYREARSKLAKPVYYATDSVAELTQEQLVTRLRQKQLKLVVQMASFENALLVESGEWVSAVDGLSRTFPACALGDQCIGCDKANWIRGQTRPVVWTSLLFPNEWEDFQSAHVFTGDRRLCVLDHRWQLTRFICVRRLTKMHASDPEASASAQCAEEVQGEQLQAFYNLVDVEEGYFNKYVMFPEANEPMIQPIVRFNRSTVVAQALESGQMRANQIQMIYKGASQLSLASKPTVGENVALF